jgi:uncharacterized protein (DUF58 family)
MTSTLAAGATRRAQVLAALAVTAGVAGVAVGSLLLVAVAAAAAMPLLLAPRDRDASTMWVSCSPLPAQLVEADPVDLVVTVQLDRRVGKLAARVEPTVGVAVDEASAKASARGADTATLTLTAHATRWGTADPPTLTVAATSRWGLRLARTRVRLPVTVVALPRPAAVSPNALGVPGQARAGNHVRRAAGDGVEFAGVRPFTVGDTLRRVHWPVSSRRGGLWVTERAAEASTDVVLVIDTFTESGPRSSSTLDASLRGSAGLARALLRNADRVGLVLLGGRVEWLEPAGSRRTWYRIVTAALRVAPGESYVTPDLNRVPRVALPPAAVVVVFTPLLDDRLAEVVADMRRRRYQVVVVDVLPMPSTRRRTVDEDLAVRLWRVRRHAAHAQLRTLGCTVTSWDGVAPLDVPLAAALRAATRAAVR